MYAPRCEWFERNCRKKIHPEQFHLSADGTLSWEEVECLGACVNAQWYRFLTIRMKICLRSCLNSFSTICVRRIGEAGPTVNRQFSAPQKMSKVRSARLGVYILHHNKNKGDQTMAKAKRKQQLRNQLQRKQQLRNQLQRKQWKKLQRKKLLRRKLLKKRRKKRQQNVVSSCEKEIY